MLLDIPCFVLNIMSHLYLYKIESLNLTQLRDAISAVRYVVQKKLTYPWIWWFMEMDLMCI